MQSPSNVIIVSPNKSGLLQVRLWTILQKVLKGMEIKSLLISYILQKVLAVRYVVNYFVPMM